MQPETAFWILSALAQSAAALAGLSAVAWAFLLTSLREDIRELRKEWGPEEQPFRLRPRRIGRFPIPNRVAGSIAGYLLATFIALGTLALVNPGTLAVPPTVLVFLGTAMGLAAVASWTMASMIANPTPFLEALISIDWGGGPES